VATYPQFVMFTLPVEPGAPTRARRAAHELDRLGDAMRADLELLLTEVVANVVRHSDLGCDEAMTIGMRIEPGRVRAEVTDGERGFPPVASPVPAPGPDAEKGYGLFLVDRLARRWGVRLERRATVWFELED
jgi:anti-sigma regulatory factor (Ser/Thr protein kinase)